MSKYIIEIAEEYEEYFKGVLICGIADGKFAVDVIAREDLEELSSDYINEHFGSLQDEAYQRGHDDGYEAGCATAFKPVSDAEYQRGYDEGYKKCLSENDFDQPCVSCEDYQRGLEEAMSAFKKLYSCGWERDWKAMGFEFDEGEWSRSFEFIIGHYTAAEIVEKVKAYGGKKIHVGDFVSHNNVPEIIVLVTYVGSYTFNGVAVTDVENHCRKGEAYTYNASEDWHKVNMQLVKGEDNA